MEEAPLCKETEMAGTKAGACGTMIEIFSEK